MGQAEWIYLIHSMSGSQAFLQAQAHTKPRAKARIPQLCPGVNLGSMLSKERDVQVGSSSLTFTQGTGIISGSRQPGEQLFLSGVSGPEGWKWELG